MKNQTDLKNEVKTKKAKEGSENGSLNTYHLIIQDREQKIADLEDQLTTASRFVL